MEKMLYRIGNLYRGYPYGVQVVEPFGSSEIHGPFSSENEANTYGVKLAQASSGMPSSYQVVKLETPQVCSIATEGEVQAYRANR
jgi:hypothetical protein